jgi:hypothetical protein
MSELTGCRRCRHYSVGRLKVGPFITPTDRFAHKCNYHGREKPRVIRWPVEGPAQPVNPPDWCPLKESPNE